MFFRLFYVKKFFGDIIIPVKKEMIQGDTFIIGSDLYGIYQSGASGCTFGVRMAGDASGI